ncbi:hypothetical protein LIT32_04535 [Bacillus sp. CMF21]|uniref:hypothetical protein n=1 Tax=Metabacillus dongyingensis TaxID=2874282 RepID=UPI001CC17081|nr:hypothetical protein [Metabacillus dongyingensis]UAL53071.1 hypothetical protein K8L98_04510 [Metabacillus dongyingensis]UOK58635.1 hypothetical protein MGI18_05640 [Bacillus sp. OVS6]USK29395.1 hypothetical protein LIT32_04535 [Bacillus sp. CMF21]
MRKIIACVLAILFFTVYSAVPAVFAEENTGLSEEEILQLVMETNEKIDSLIVKAVAEAEKIESKYLHNKNKTEEKMAQLQAELTKLSSEFPDAKDDEKMKKRIENLEEKLLKEKEKFAEFQNEFDRELGDLIQNLVDVTNEMSAKTISKAAENGVTVECTWVLVELGGKKVWVDPLKVVGP